MYRANVAHKLVQINAGQRSSGTTTNFSVNFDSRDLDRVTSVTMVKATLPRLFPNIWSSNWQIDIQHPAGTDNFFTVPAGQYTATTLAAALSTATAGINVAWTYDTTLSRFHAVYSGVTTATLVSNPALSTIAYYIGLSSDIVLGAPANLPDPPQLSGPDEILVQSQLVGGTSTVVAGSQTSIPMVGVIDFTNTPYGFTGQFHAQDLSLLHIEYPYQTVMRRIDVQLTDMFYNEIVLPENAFLNMVLQFSYIPI